MKDFDIDYNQFKDLSCYEEFEMKCTLTGISKINVLKEISHEINNYYFFVSDDGIFNWFDWNGNHIEDPGILKEIEEIYIPRNITRCFVPDSVTCIGMYAFYGCDSLKEVAFKGKTLEEVKQLYNYPFGIEDESIIKCEK